jgi:hypothetical protein
MARRKGMGYLEAFARWATVWTGSSGAFALAVLTVVAWAVTGPYYHYSDTWQAGPAGRGHPGVPLRRGGGEPPPGEAAAARPSGAVTGPGTSRGSPARPYACRGPRTPRGQSSPSSRTRRSRRCSQRTASSLVRGSA